MENKINYSKSIRKTFKKLLQMTEIELKEYIDVLKEIGVQVELQYEACIETLQNSTKNNQITEMLKLYGLISDYDQRMLEIIKTSIYIQSYTDFYILGRYLNTIEKNDRNFSKINFEIIEKEYFNTPDIYVMMLKSMDLFENLSAYDKIISHKKLTKEENEMLKSINPIYEYEKNKYDIEITKGLITNQMNKWKKSFDLETAQEKTIEFIFKLYSLNPNNINELFEELNITGEKQLIDDEAIIFNDTYVTKEILTEKLKEEINNKEKVKK